MEQNSETGGFKIRRTQEGVMILDCLRNKYVPLTPEEEVRQSFVRFLMEEKGYPAGLMGNEVAIVQNGIRRRCDTVVFSRAGEPLMIVEYKAASVKITQTVFDQIYRYNTVLKVKYLTVFNGRRLYCCRIDYERGESCFLEDVPSYGEL